MAPLLILILVGLLALSFSVTRAMERYAKTRGIEDVPNERSSHRAPTPRGGGVGIVASALVGWLVLGILGFIDVRALAALIVGGGAIAWTGWVDDRQSLSARARLAVQFAVALAVVVALADRLNLLVGPALSLGFAASAVIAVLYIVWMTNLYNFMDGIDGIAAGQCATVAAVVAAFLILCGVPQLAWAYLVLVPAALGFLRLNWSPARIFMGDVGSAFLGFAFATLSLIHGTSSFWPASALPIVATLAMGSFIVDSGVTLARRLAAKKKVWLAHRDHAYQKAVRRGYSHAQVALAFVSLNVLWLGSWVLSLIVVPGEYVWVVVTVALLPLVVVCVKFGAGVSDPAPLS